jgi:amino acid permease
MNQVAATVPLCPTKSDVYSVVQPRDRQALEVAEAVAAVYSGGGHGGDEKSSPWGAMANIINCMVGAGVIGIPWAIRQCGFIMGTIALVCVALMLTHSGLILIHLGDRSKCSSLESLAVHLLGGWAYYVVLITVIAFAFGAMTAYVVILGDVLPPVVALFLPEALSSRIVVVLFCSVFIILPLCLMRSMSALSAASALSIFADICLIGIVLFAGPIEAYNQGLHLIGPNEALLPHYGFFAGIGETTTPKQHICTLSEYNPIF